MTTARRCTLLVLLFLLCSPAGCLGDARRRRLRPALARRRRDAAGGSRTASRSATRARSTASPTRASRCSAARRTTAISLSTSLRSGPTAGWRTRRRSTPAPRTPRWGLTAAPRGSARVARRRGSRRRRARTTGRCGGSARAARATTRSGPVRRLTLRSPVAPRLSAPGRAYAGYAFFVTAQAAGVPDGTTAVVQRRSGSKWRSRAPRPSWAARREAAIVLPRGDAAGPGQPRDRRSAGRERGAAGEGAPRPALEHRAARHRALQGEGRRALRAAQGDRSRASAA